METAFAAHVVLSIVSILLIALSRILKADAHDAALDRMPEVSWRQLILADENRPHDAASWSRTKRAFQH